MEEKVFIREYVKAIEDGVAAVFAGAGLSRGCGYVDWKELLKEAASDIGLEIDKETDLISVAQYIENKRSRSKINEKILEEFSKNAQKNVNLKILASLPISTYWTTNYDEIIEEHLKDANKKYDVKLTEKSIPNNMQGRDAVIYKMHGDKRLASEAVITKEDYETYNQKRALFTTALQGDLLSKRFVFIGFSFDDPNLEQILSRIRILLEEHAPTHYCLMKKVSLKDCNDNDKDFEYKTIKQELKIEDLRRRYKIEVIQIDNYEDITRILREIENKHRLSNVFISGSAENYGDWDEKKALEFMHKLSSTLVKENLKIISGFGVGIGSAVINGALEEIMANKYGHVGEYLTLRPFPQFKTGEKDISEMWKEYRQMMISSAGICLFVFGNKLEDKIENGKRIIISNNVIDADGIYKEFEIAIQQNKYVIPIASTGYMTKKIFDRIKTEINNFKYLELYLDILEKERDEKELIKTIGKIIKDIKKL